MQLASGLVPGNMGCSSWVILIVTATSSDHRANFAGINKIIYSKYLSLIYLLYYNPGAIVKASILGTGCGTITGVIRDMWHRLQHNLLE